MAYFNTDIPELKGYDTGLCLSNVDVLAARQNRVTESMLAVLRELAAAMLRDAEGDPDTLESILLSLRSEEDTAAPDGEAPPESLRARMLAAVSPVNRELIPLVYPYMGLSLRLILYRFIRELSEKTEERLPAPPRLPETVRGRVAYMPGAFADKAYERLSRLIPRPRAAAFHSFVEACEEVRGGLCEYGILPLENTRNGKLTSFSRLILRYGLTVVAVCDLEDNSAEGQATRFALLRKGPEGDFPQPLSPVEGRRGHREEGKTPPLCLELLHATDSPTLTELLTAAEHCGLTLLRVDTIPHVDLPDEASEVDGGAGGQAVCCVFSAGSSDLSTFRRFLSLEASEDIPMGLYYVHN